jgi:hypothetical protein
MLGKPQLDSHHPLFRQGSFFINIIYSSQKEMTRYFISVYTIAPYSQIIDYMVYILSNSQEDLMIKVISSLIQKIFTSNPELVYMCAADWLAIYEQLLPQRESLGVELKELLSIIQRHHFHLGGESVADIKDGGPAFYGIIIPLHLHSHLNELRNN